MDTASNHVLNWELIINKSDANGKGILFENLIEKLLIAMFPKETWKRTEISHDGKRDFVYPADDFLPEEKWAECKNYSDNLSINVISPTLIIGAIENIDQIYFFSYSKLNDNAIDGILKFSNFSKKIIKVFDGDLLESLICKYHKINGIGDFFPNTDFNTAFSFLESKCIRVLSSLRDHNGQKISTEHVFELGESFNLNITVQNLSLKTCKFKIEVLINKENVLSLNKYVFEDSISFAEIKEKNINIQTLKQGKVSIDINIIPALHNENSTTHKIKKTINITEESYLFWTGDRAFKTRDKCFDHLLKYNEVPLIIGSKSGAGKSTLLNIINSENNIQAKYTVINLDLELSRSYGAKNMLYQTLNLIEDEKVPYSQCEDQKKYISVLLTDYAKSANMISQNLMKLYNAKKPFLFIIDDVQKINRAYIEVICELNSISSSQQKPIYYVFALNTDLLSLDSLIIRLNWDKNYGNNKYEYIELSYFNKTEIISFFKHKFGLFEIDKFFENYENEISPLEIQSFSSYIVNKHIISYNPIISAYQLIDKIQFVEDINKILYTSYSVNELCSVFYGSDIIEYILKYLCINNELLLSENDNYIVAIKQLVSSKIIKEINGKAVFSHEKIKNTVKDKLIYTEDDYADIFYNVNSTIEGKVICAIKQLNRIYDAPSFLNVFFEKNIETKKSEQLYEICWIIFENIELLENFNLISLALKFVRDNLKKLSIELSQNKYYDLVSYIFKIVKSKDWDFNEECVEYIAYFIKKYFDRSLSTHNHSQSYNDYLEIKECFSKIKNISEGKKNFWLSHYSNRAAIALDRESSPFEKEPENVQNIYNISENYCNNATDKDELLLQIYIDNFYRKYVYHPNLNLAFIIETRNKLISLNKNRIERKICLKYHLILLEYLEFKMRKNNNNSISNNFVLRIANLRQESTSSFYNLKLYILEIYALIDLKEYIKANEVLGNAMKFAFTKGMRNNIYKLTYIQAFLLKFINKDDYRYQSKMILALEQFVNTKGMSQNSIYRESYILQELFSAINSFSNIFINEYLKKQNSIIVKSLEEINNSCKTNSSFKNNNSYFIFENTNFPSV